MAKKAAVKGTAKKSRTRAVKKSPAKAPKKPARKSGSTGVIKAAAATKTSKTRYITAVPKSIPAGKILCHGGIIPVTNRQKPSVNGFRPWVDAVSNVADYGPCNCGWSGLDHYMPLAWLESSRKEYDGRKYPKKKMV